MEGISDIRIIGFDATRPPRVHKEPYIDLFFELAHKAPMDWCKTFNDLASKASHTTKIDPADGLFIESWVRQPDEIEGVLSNLKKTVQDCNEAYIERVRREASDRSNEGTRPEDEGAQGKLNRIVAALNFDD